MAIGLAADSTFLTAIGPAADGTSLTAIGLAADSTLLTAIGLAADAVLTLAPSGSRRGLGLRDGRSIGQHHAGNDNHGA
ncbi:hypothetical protein ABK905_22745 [Acerihabitans sp. KWT182]|uniref:Uncharacterized protein n=1 Tax=Acerihabitans sp. KWT182 TaxID=3157919 RepID=A0AAU7Q7R9_9GAMM